MEDYQLRVMIERKELDDKIAKLGAFLNSDKVPLDDADLNLLELQYQVMKMYSTILVKRVARFK